MLSQLSNLHPLTESIEQHVDIRRLNGFPQIFFISHEGTKDTKDNLKNNCFVIFVPL